MYEQEQFSFPEIKKKNILISLQEEYFLEMLSGIKKYEYRSRFLKEECIAYIYISKTRKSIVGKIEFGQPIVGTAKEIANIAEQEQAGVYEDMISYLHRDIGYAIPVGHISLFENEISLSDLKTEFKDFVPPQAYFDLDKKTVLLAFLEKRK